MAYAHGRMEIDYESRDCGENVFDSVSAEAQARCCSLGPLAQQWIRFQTGAGGCTCKSNDMHMLARQPLAAHSVSLNRPQTSQAHRNTQDSRPLERAALRAAGRPARRNLLLKGPRRQKRPRTKESPTEVAEARPHRGGVGGAHHTHPPTPGRWGRGRGGSRRVRGWEQRAERGVSVYTMHIHDMRRPRGSRGHTRKCGERPAGRGWGKGAGNVAKRCTARCAQGEKGRADGEKERRERGMVYCARHESV